MKTGPAEAGDAGGCHPQEPVTLQHSVAAPKKIARLSIHLIDSGGLDRGALGEVFVTIKDEGH